MSTDQKTKVVTVVVVYSTRETVRIQMAHDMAVRVVAHAQSAMCALAPYYGIDAKGDPFSVNVGSAANAIYIEE